MKVNETAHAYGISTKELLAELKAAFPGQKLTANSDLPEGFERTVQAQNKADLGKQTGKDAQIVTCVRNGKRNIKNRLIELLG